MEAFFALLVAIAGGLVIARLGRPGWKGLLHDIAIALLTLVLTRALALGRLTGPVAIKAPMSGMFSLAYPMTASAAIIGCAVLLVYARLTVPRPPTSPPA